MRRLQILIVVLVVFAGTASGQILRYRVSGTTSMIFKETGDGEITNPSLNLSEYSSATDFSPTFALGADLEVMAPITDYFEAGLEFEYGKLSGRTETPKLYNFWLFDWVNPLPEDYIYPSEPVVYETTQLSILGTARAYLLPQQAWFNMFVKVFGGISFVGTDLKFNDPYYNVEYDVGVLYAQGTKNSQDPKDRAFHGGVGIGGQYKLTERMAVYLEGSGSFINSDIVNGVPDLDYMVGAGREYEPAEGIGTLTGQISVGLVYSAIPDRRLNRSNYTRSRRVTGRQNWLRDIFNPFRSNRRRR